MSKGQGKLLTKKLIKVQKQNTNQGIFLKSLPWLVNRNLCLKIINYQNIFLLQYCVPKCLVCVGPKREWKECA